MSLHVKHSLKLERRVRNEDNGQSAEKKSESRPPEHSTPKRSLASQDSHAQECRSSPILLTQDANTEVTWDWQSPQTKAKPRQKPDAASTPKRPQLFHKKRNSNSPLIYKPFKKRIIRHDNIVSIDKLKSDFLALDAQIATASPGETPDSNDISDEILFSDFVDDDFNVDEVPKLPESPPDPPVVTSSTDIHVVDSKEKESLEDMFNDSLNDESLLRCSQEIEEKLNIGPARPTSSTSSASSAIKSYGLASALNPKPAASPTSKFKKHKSEPIDNTSSNNQRNGKDFKSSDFIDLDDFDVPDDSFDEILKAACAQVPKYDALGTPSSSKSGSTRTNDSKADLGQSKLYYKQKLPAKAVPAAAKPSVPSTLLKGNLNGTSTQSASNSGNDRRFFKSRNRSDSSFDSSSRLNSQMSCAGVSFGARGGKTNSSSVSTMMDLRRAQTTVGHNVIIKESTNCINHFDRLKVSDVGNLSCTPVTRSQTLCTPEEIERKRNEAKSRLEAKRKMQNSRNAVKR